MVNSPKVVTKFYTSDGHKYIVDEGALMSFQDATESNINGLESKINNTLGVNQASHEIKIGQLEADLDRSRSVIRMLEKDLEIASGFLHHIGILNPEWVESFKATQQVTERLEDANEIREVQESAF